MKTHIPSIIGVGGVTIDHVYVVNGYPPPDGVAYIQSNYSKIGGMIGNAVIAASRMGAATHIVGGVGQDSDGETVARILQQAEVDTTYLQHLSSDSTSYSVIVVEPEQQTRAILNYKGVQERSELPGVESVDLRAADCLHIDTFWFDTAIDLAKRAKSSGIPVTLDVPPAGQRNRTLELLQYVDYFIPSITAAENLANTKFSDYPDDVADFLLKQGPEVVVITKGAEGVFFKRRGEKGQESPSFRITAVDTTGAGDVFHGAFAYGVTQSFPLDYNVRFASAAAAMKCASSKNHEDSFPSCQELLRFLKNQGSLSIS